MIVWFIILKIILVFIEGESKKGVSKEEIIEILVGDDSIWDLSDDSEDKKELIKLIWIFEIDGFVDGLDVKVERKFVLLIYLGFWFV